MSDGSKRIRAACDLTACPKSGICDFRGVPHTRYEPPRRPVAASLLALDVRRVSHDLAFAGWSLRVNVVELDGVLHVRAVLPDVGVSDVTAVVEKHSLVIRGERDAGRAAREGASDGGRPGYAGFYWSSKLPNRALVDGVRSVFRDGVLVVTVPMSPTPRAPDAA